MAMQARLFLGPRDGEKVSIVEPLEEIEIMTGTQKDSDREYDVHIYKREDRQEAPGVFRYNYVGAARAEGPDGSQ